MTRDLLMHFPVFILTCTLSAYVNIIKETLHMCKYWNTLSFTLKLGHCQTLDNLVFIRRDLGSTKLAWICFLLPVCINDYLGLHPSGVANIFLLVNRSCMLCLYSELLSLQLFRMTVFLYFWAPCLFCLFYYGTLRQGTFNLL